MSDVSISAADLRILWVPFPDKTSALQVAHSAIEAKLAACVNLIPGSTSIYEWEGKIVEETEVIAVFKTHASREDELRSWIADRHPYDVPCIASWEMSAINPRWRSWLTDIVGVGTM